MKKVYFLIILLLIFLTIVLITSKGKSAITGLFWNTNLELSFNSLICKYTKTYCSISKNNTNVNFGVYDFNNTFGDNKNIAINHYFLDWNNIDEIGTLSSIFTEAESKDRWVMLTIEPFKKSDEVNLFDGIKRGDYDNNIEQICLNITFSKNPVFVRWGHEMERVTGRYDWASNDTNGFKYSYNYFVEKCKTFTSNAFYVWSPAGENNLDNYWPGEKNVDYVGVSLYIYDKFENQYYKRIRSFHEAFEEKYSRVEKYNKPIIIAEFGITIADNLLVAWWKDAINSLNNFANLKTIVYFNAKDSAGVWGELPTPNWSIPNIIYPEYIN